MIKKLKKIRADHQLPSASDIKDKAVSLNPLTPKSEEPTVPEVVPRITNETIAEHREQVLKGARKYIYPLQHSKHRIVVVTSSIIGGTIVALFIYCLLALYHFHQYNTFVYRMTQVVPFPVARADGHFVDYENYLFELRHYVHYYQTQQQIDFSTSDKQQLTLYRRQALSDVVNNAYVTILAHQKHVSVSSGEVNARIAEVRAQNRLGSNNKVFADVLRDYWGWSVNDFKRELKTQMLAEKVDAAMDTATTARANSALAQLKSGTDFTTLAQQVSDDTATKANGGNYGNPITLDNPNIPPQVIEELFKLKAGQASGIIDAGATLEIVKVSQISGGAVTAQHISFNLTPLATYIAQLKSQHPPKNYIKL